MNLQRHDYKCLALTVRLLKAKVLSGLSVVTRRGNNSHLICSVISDYEVLLLGHFKNFLTSQSLKHHRGCDAFLLAVHSYFVVWHKF
jgi:hypothetical protein